MVYNNLQVYIINIIKLGMFPSSQFWLVVCLKYILRSQQSLIFFSDIKYIYEYCWMKNEHVRTVHPMNFSAGSCAI